MSPSTSELARMVVRLSGDDSGYRKMLAGAAKATADGAAAAERSARRMGASLGKASPRRLGADAAEAGKGLKRYARDTADAVDTTQMLNGGMQLASKRLNFMGLSLRGYGVQAAAMILPLVGVAGAMNTVSSSVREAASQESTEMAFETLVGDADKAKRALKDLRAFADETPFEMPELLAGAKQMVAFGSSVGNIVKDMRMLGDVASGTGTQLTHLTYIYGTLRAQGRAFTVDINQFATKGIPIWEKLAQVMYKDEKATDRVRHAVEAGQVTFVEVEKAFKLMTGEGGRFHNMMDKQSRTTQGRFSTMNDTIGGVRRELGRHIIEAFRLKEAMMAVTDQAKRVQDWLAGLSAETRNLIVVLVPATAAVGAFMAAWPYLGDFIKPGVEKLGKSLLHLLNPMTAVRAATGLINSAFLAMLSPLGLVVGVVALLGLGWASQFDSMGEAVEDVKAQLNEWWEWLQPVFKALKVLGVEAFEAIMVSVNNLREIALDAFRTISGDSGLNWQEIKDTAVKAIMFVAYTVNHFQDVVEMVGRNLPEIFDAAWAKFKLGFLNLMQWAVRNSQKLFLAFVRVVEKIGKAFKMLIDQIQNGRIDLGKILKESLKLSDIWPKDEEVHKIPFLERLVGDAKDASDEAMSALKKKLAEDPVWQDFEKWMAEKMKPAGPAEGLKDVSNAADDAAKKTAALNKELHKLDATSIRSAEAAGRFREYKEKLKDPTAYFGDQEKRYKVGLATRAAMLGVSLAGAYSSTARERAEANAAQFENRRLLALTSGATHYDHASDTFMTPTEYERRRPGAYGFPATRTAMTSDFMMPRPVDRDDWKDLGRQSGEKTDREILRELQRMRQDAIDRANYERQSAPRRAVEIRPANVGD